MKCGAWLEIHISIALKERIHLERKCATLSAVEVSHGISQVYELSEVVLNN